MALPNTYVRLDYIQSSGTQYIDSGVIPNFDNFEVNIKNFCVVSATTAWEVYFGCETNDSASDSYQFRKNNENSLIIASSGHYSSSPHGSYQYSYSPGTLLNEVKIKNGILYVNGTITTATGLSSSKETPTRNMYIFARQSDSAMRNSSIRFSRFSITNNNVLVRDFVPAMRVSDSEIGLYDLVNDQFYVNAGSGEFTYGSIVDDKPNIYFEDNPLIIQDIGGDVSLTANFERAASLRYKVNGVWKYAIPYIKLNGNWYKAIAYRKTNGVWKQGI